MRNTKQASLLQALDSLEKDGFWPLRVQCSTLVCIPNVVLVHAMHIYTTSNWGGGGGGGGISLSKVVPIVYRDGNGT